MKRFSFASGMTASSWLLAVLVIIAELIAPFKSFVTAIFSHHWIAKGVLITIAFLAVGFLFREKITKGSEHIAWYSTLGSLIIIFLFYLIEYTT